MNLFELFGTISLKDDGFTKGIEDAKGVFGKFESAADKAMGAIVHSIQAAGTAIYGLAAAAVKSGIDYESAFAGVRKTVDATEEQFQALSDGIRNMAKEIPASASEIANLAETAGQLGIKTDNILDFTRVVADLGVATNIVGQEGAAQIARFANIVGMSQGDFDKFGSSIVALGNNFATTEAEILSMSMRLAGAGAQVGMSEADILGLATALSSVGIEAEMGGSAISKVLVNMSAAGSTADKLNGILDIFGMSLRELELLADADGKKFKAMAQSLEMTSAELKALMKQGSNLENFAKISGMTGEQFKQAFETDAVGALQSFIGGLANAEDAGSSAIEMLQEMGITEVRLRDSLLRAANAGDLLTDAVKLSSEAWDENSALTKEAEQRYNTMESQITILKNKVVDLGISFYESVNNPMAEVIKTAGQMVERLSVAFGTGGLSGLVSEIGSVLADIITEITNNAQQFVQVGFNLLTSLVNGLTENKDIIINGARITMNTLFDGIRNLLPELIPLAKDVLALFVEGFIQYKELVWTVGIDIIIALATGIADNLDILIPTAQNAIMNIVNTITTNLPAVLQAGIEIILALSNGIVEILPTLIPVAVDIILMIVNTIIDNLPKILVAGIDIIMALVDGIVQSIPKIIEAIPNIIVSFITGIAENLPKIILSGIDIIMSLVTGIINAIPDLIMAIPKIISAIVDTLISFDWIGLGKQIIEKLINGFLNMVNKVAETAKNVGESIINGIKDALGLNSGKSKMVVIGEQAGQDFINGMVERIGGGGQTVGNGVGRVIKTVSDETDKFGGIGANGGNAYINSLATIITDSEPQIKKSVETASKSLLDGIDKAGEAGKTTGKKYVDELSKEIESSKDKTSKASESITESINEGFQTKTVDINKAISDLVKLIEELGSTTSSMKKRAADFGTGLTMMARDLYDFAYTNGNTITLVSDRFTVLGKSLKETASGISEVSNTIFDSIVSAINDVDLVFGTFASNIEEVSRQSMEGFRDGVVNTSKEIFIEVGNGVKDVETLFNKFLTYFNDFSAKMKEIGKNGMAGFRDGFVGAAKLIFEDIQYMFKDFLRDTKSVFGIHSPSKEFAWIGEMNMEGFAVGVEGMKRRVDGAIDNVFGDLGGDIGYNAVFGAQSPQSTYTTADRASTANAATQPFGGNTYILNLNQHVKMDEVDEVYKLMDVFKNFEYNRVAFEGVS